ncbi:phosphoribosylglycinamide formyltransferase [Candidatus Pelagibacter communis]|uniref:phosphoribosylglycinamide formyltransferase n=1 Tax=Pelagibacter ubique TaxID=198252 RepID=UPI00094D3F48|nr:phosphoribosylglycinamide formyltransferase [Candidatus Pelagibacter ubique]
MEKLIGRNLNISVFISGRGSNLLSLIKYSKNKNSKIKINLIISNNKFSKGLEFAKKYKIKHFIIDYSKEKQAEHKIYGYLKKNKIDLICLAGFMKILSPGFIKKFKNPILNIHPSLLPKYKGLNTHIRAIENKDKFSGATVHVVTPKLDSGKIILQKKVRILKSDTEKTLAKKILKIEHKLYPAAIEKILKKSSL